MEKIKIAMGAEAVIYLVKENDKIYVLKERIEKRYRHPIIDKRFRKYRTRREAKVIQKLNEIGIPCPKLFEVNEDQYYIKMEYIDGKKLSEILENLNYKKICKEIGYYVGLMHKNNIIHGDLTTSNILYKDGKIYFIDFGLSFFSSRIEDKAVDIHLFKEALESKHWKIWKECFEKFLEGYKEAYPEKFEEIYRRFLDVERRGRYKH